MWSSALCLERGVNWSGRRTSWGLGRHVNVNDDLYHAQLRAGQGCMIAGQPGDDMIQCGRPPGTTGWGQRVTIMMIFWQRENILTKTPQTGVRCVSRYYSGLSCTIPLLSSPLLSSTSTHVKIRVLTSHPDPVWNIKPWRTDKSRLGFLAPPALMKFIRVAAAWISNKMSKLSLVITQGAEHPVWGHLRKIKINNISQPLSWSSSWAFKLVKHL